MAEQDSGQSAGGGCAIPGSGVGVELRGALPLGESGSLFNYAFYGVNGPGSADGSGNASALDLGGNVGIKSDGTTANLHNNPTGGGRLSVFVPFKPHYDLELGVSGQAGEWDNNGNHLWLAGVLDAALHLGPNFEAKAQYMITRFGSDDAGLVRQQGWFAQVGYKLSGLDLELPVVNNLELVGRYDSLRGWDQPHQPAGTRWVMSIISPAPCCLRATMNSSTRLIRPSPPPN